MVIAVDGSVHRVDGDIRLKIMAVLRLVLGSSECTVLQITITDAVQDTHRGYVGPAGGGGDGDVAENSTVHLSRSEAGVTVSVDEGRQGAELAPVGGVFKQGMERLHVGELHKCKQSNINISDVGQPYSFSIFSEITLPELLSKRIEFCWQHGHYLTAHTISAFGRAASLPRVRLPFCQEVIYLRLLLFQKDVLSRYSRRHFDLSLY